MFASVPETEESGVSENENKKGKFSPAGPVEPDGAIREVEESPLPEPEGMGLSATLEGDGLSPEEIERLQKK